MSGRIINPEYADDELIQRLMQFYGVYTIPELVRAQDKQIEKLQARLAVVDREQPAVSFHRGG